MRFLVIGYTAKGGVREFSSTQGYKLTGNTTVPSYTEIRKGCLEWANKEGDNFDFFSIKFMNFLEEADYNSFMEVTD